MTATCQAVISGVLAIPYWAPVHYHYCDDVLGANLHAVTIGIARAVYRLVVTSVVV